MKTIKLRRGGTAQPWNMAMNPEIWREVFDAFEDPAFLHDKQFRVLFANGAYCRAAGVTKAQALGKPLLGSLPAGYQSSIARQITRHAYEEKDHE